MNSQVRLDAAGRPRSPAAERLPAHGRPRPDDPLALSKAAREELRPALPRRRAPIPRRLDGKPDARRLGRRQPAVDRRLSLDATRLHLQLAPGADRYGGSEYVLRQGSFVNVTSVERYAPYCGARPRPDR
jgi:hypothetical protein